VRLGLDEEGLAVLLDDQQRAQQTYIVGKSGVGKTKLLEAIVLQDLLRGVPVVFFDLIGTAVPYLRQCLAAINLSGLASERGPYPALNRRLRRERERFFRRIRFVDLDTTDPQDRFNPLEPVAGMSTAELAEGFAAAIERMLGGKLSEMRALHLNLVGIASVVIETGGGTVEDMVELLCTGTDTLKDYLKRIEQKRAQGRLRVPVRPDLITRYLSEFFAMTSGRERRELSASTLRALAIILSDPVAKRFLSSPRGNVNLDAVMREGHCRLVNVPPRNLHTQTVIAGLLLGRLVALAMRRSSQDVIAGLVPQVHVVVDEFQRIFTEEMAADLAVLRNKGISMILAHQSSNQPPFHAAEGQAMLHSVRDNCSTKMVMRVGPKDAEELAGECFLPDGHLVKRQFQEVTHSSSESSGRTLSRAEAQGSTRSEGQSRTQSQTRSLTRAQGRSSSESQGTQTSQTEGHTQTRTEGQSQGSSQTLSTGRTQGSSHTDSVGRTESSGESSTHGHSRSTGSGHNYSYQYGQRSSSDTRQQSKGRSDGSSSQQTESDSSSHSATRTTGHSTSQSEGRSQSESQSQAHGQSTTQSSSQSQGSSQSCSQARSQARTRGQSRTLTQGLSHGESQALSQSEAQSHTRTRTEGESQGRSQGQSTREVTEYYSVMEETIIRSYELMSLPNRSVIVLRQGNGQSTMQRMRTLDLPQQLVTQLGPLDGLADLNRLIAPPPAEPEPTLSIVERLRLTQQILPKEEDG
jgi:hypothetical protein